MDQDMPGFKQLRHSKFRHVFGKPFRREKCYDGINISRNAHDNNFCAVNPKFLAIVTESAGGGSFIVIPLERVGRVGLNFNKVCGHTGAVMDIKWDPFDDHIIASAAEDGKVRIWHIPEGGLQENMETPKHVLNSHTRRCNCIEWHPTAKNILASTGYDRQLLIWNVRTEEIVFKIDCHPDIIFCLSFNWDGSRIATTCKDKIIRIIDPRSGVVTQEGKGHQGSKSAKCVYAGDTGRLISVGSTRTSERQVFLWDQDDLSAPIANVPLSAGTGILFPYYDPDCNVLYIGGKGDSSLLYYEILPEPPYFFYLNQFQTSGPQRGLGYMPKRGVDTKINEVVRFYKLHASKNLCEPISMIVPRKGEAFQADLYPDTASDQPALTAEEWVSGIDAPPHLLSLGGVARPISSFPPAPTPAKVPLRESSVKSSDNIPKPASSSTSSSFTSSSLSSSSSASQSSSQPLSLSSSTLPTASSTMIGNKPTAIVTGINKSEPEIQPISGPVTETMLLLEKENINIKREDSETNSIKEKSERELLEKDTNARMSSVDQQKQDQENELSTSSSTASTTSSRSSIFAHWKNREAESRNSSPSQVGSFSRGDSRKLRDHPFRQLDTSSRSSSGEIEVHPEQRQDDARSSPSFRSPLSSTSDDFEVERSLTHEGREVFRINMSPTRQPSIGSGSPSRRAPNVSDSTTRRQMSMSSTEPTRAPSLTDTNRRSASVSDERGYSSMASSIATRFTLSSNGDRRNLDDEPLLTSKDMGMDQLRKAYLRQQEDIKQLKSKLLLKDQRIRQLEREIESLTNESNA
ncbi:coronin-2B-like [Diadema setosum]|uniref:coronin-2B-like n=1 Tax=Diadema setosum TaxID=31175 RepID=UPI003B3A32AA